jgi:hypothetical protein
MIIPASEQEHERGEAFSQRPLARLGELSSRGPAPALTLTTDTAIPFIAFAPKSVGH